MHTHLFFTVNITFRGYMCIAKEKKKVIDKLLIMKVCLSARTEAGIPIKETPF